MPCEEVYDLDGVLDVPLDAERKSFDTLEENPGIERRDGRTGVTENDGPDSGHEGSGSCDISEHCSVVGRIGSCKARIALGILLPVKLSAVDYHTSQR